MTLEVAPAAGPAKATEPSIALLGSYPPDRGAVASHNRGLVEALAGAGPGHVSVIRTGADSPVITDPRVVSQLRPLWQQPPSDAVRALNAHDLVLVQHEFPRHSTGHCQDQALVDLHKVMDRIEVPILSTLHEVPVAPTAVQQMMLTEIAARSAAVIAPSDTARERVIRLVDIDPAAVVSIPRGAVRPSIADLRVDPTRIVTPGLLEVGKGVEWVIEGLAQMTELIPAVRYVVVGPDASPAAATYRRMLTQLAAARGLGDRVIIDDRVLSPQDLAIMMATSACVILPYEDLRRASSAVLVDAICAGTPVIATTFDHATELLGGGAGLLVEPGDAAGLAVAIETLVTRTHLRNQMAEVARSAAERLSWSAVAGRYRQLIEDSLWVRDAASP